MLRIKFLSLTLAIYFLCSSEETCPSFFFNVFGRFKASKMDRPHCLLNGGPEGQDVPLGDVKVSVCLFTHPSICDVRSSIPFGIGSDGFRGIKRTSKES